MTTSEMFRDFLINLKITNADQISLRYGEITAVLNKTFRNTESKTANSLQVGSYGRWSAIDGVSDLDMLLIMPYSLWSSYKDGKQSKLLTDTKNAIKARYPRTTVSVDRLVVRVLYTDFHIEVQPVFEIEDRNFFYPDTYGGGKWKITKPREEIAAMSEVDKVKNNNLRRLCKIARAWKNKHGVGMGGLLIDTLAHNFLKSTTDYDDKSYAYYDWMSRDFFYYLKELPDQEYFAALGSRQRVKVKQKFQKKAKKAYELCLEAIEAEGKDTAHAKWKKVFGRPFPAKPAVSESAAVTKSWRNTEEFIEDRFPIDIRFALKIDCEVSQNGFRTFLLRDILRNKTPLKPEKKLKFTIIENTVPPEYEIYWKVLNRGAEAIRRDRIRGQILPDQGNHTRSETTDFTGEHIVECYAVQNGVVVAKDRIDVPIQ